MKSRRFWAGALTAIVGMGILSRTVPTGFGLTDKYLGDALYAAMIYAVLRLLGAKSQVTLSAMLSVCAIECFQLTNIPERMSTSDSAAVRVAARLLGTHFSFFDIAAYAVGVICARATDRR